MAYTGARAAEYGTISARSHCSQVVLRTPLLESDLCHPTCAIRAATAGGGGGKSHDKRGCRTALIGTHHLLPT